MAFLFDVNREPPASYAEVWFRWKEALKAAGWTVTHSSDGTTYNASGDQITHAGTGAGGLNNSRAWIVVRQPGPNGREFCYQRDTSTGSQVRIKYSGGPGTGFTGGSPTATVTPSATDEQIITGSGTDASPTFGSWTNLSNGLFRADIIAGRGPEGWSFAMVHTSFHTSSAGAWFSAGLSSIFVLDVMRPGTANPLDADPAVVFLGASGSNVITALAGMFSPARTWMRKGLQGEGWVQLGFLNQAIGGTTSVMNMVGRNPYDPTGPDELRPCVWARPLNNNAPAGLKGVSTIFREVGTMRGAGTTLSYAAPDARDWMVIGGTDDTPYYAIPWDGSLAMLR